MLSKDASSENPTQHLRGGPGRCSWTGQDKGIRAITPLSQEDRDAVRTPEAHSAAWPIAPSRSRRRAVRVHPGSDCAEPSRSEEHTSELQSHLNLVCRLLLEKKKKNHIIELE